MRKDDLPHSFKKQRMLYDDRMEPEVLVSWAERYLEAGRVFDAAAFFRKAGHEEGMARLKAMALEQGDAFLFKVAVRGAPGQARPQEWDALGRRAMELARFSHAVNAFRSAGNEEMRKRAEEGLSSLFSRPEVTDAPPVTDSDAE